MPEWYTNFVVKSNILESISTFYKDDPERVFFEYIDNSLDSAWAYFNAESNSYTKEILIKFDINTKNKEVTITDNCDWINDLGVLITSIWLHQVHWKNDHWQFWYWVFSFPAIANKIRIKTKNIWKISWEELNISIEDIRNWYTRNPQKVPYIWDWTEIVLSEFIEKKFLKDLTVENIKGRIEKHLEWILWRKNLRIEITKDRSEPIVCSPFNYEQYQWEVYEKIIPTIWKDPIKIYLKVIENKQIDRPPFLMIRWREIESICEIQTFRSKNKSAIWKHPNIIWYIDLWNSASPNLARNGVKLDASTKWVFNKIIELEPEISELIQKVNKITQNEHYKKLETKLTSVLSKLSKIDNMKYRPIEASKADWNWTMQWEVVDVNWLEWKDWNWAQDHNNWNITPWGDRRSIWTLDWDGFWPTQNPWEDFPWEEKKQWGSFKWLDPIDWLWGLWTMKRWDWFSIKFEDIEVPEDENGNKIRSTLVDGEIIIYKNHPDFVERTKTFRDWNDKITERLITYLAWEITVHYKDTFHNKHWQPQYNKWMFVDLVEFIYSFEKELQDLVWQNLADI